MIRIVDLRVHPDAGEGELLRAAIAADLGIDPARVGAWRITRRGIDARHRRVHLQLRIEVALDGADLAPDPLDVPDLPTLTGTPYVAIIGAGPAGMFAAEGLARRGVRSIVFERGADVRGRRPALAKLNREGVLDADSNYCFGEGGAGTFSDGKLYTRAKKRGSIIQVLDLLCACGAPPEIRAATRPHIGTNRLPKVVTALRERLIAAGVQIHFKTRVDDILFNGGAVSGVVLGDGSTVPVTAVILATGHSARDVYRMLGRNKVAIEAKSFALGVRIEHPQPHIDAIQYGGLAGHAQLGAAPYSLRHTADGVGTYSFCMCPGGFIVAAATSPGEIVVNGMSPSTRNSRFANSGMVVSVGPEVYGSGPLDGLAWQAEVENAAFEAGGGKFVAPAQRVTDFLAGRVSSSLPDCSYRPGLASVDLKAVLPAEIHRPLAEALRIFNDRRMPGYITEDAVMLGVESRSSSPLRVLRDPESLQSPTHPGLFPCGEGAGFAGGIVSAALDGLRVAERIPG